MVTDILVSLRVFRKESEIFSEIKPPSRSRQICLPNKGGSAFIFITMFAVKDFTLSKNLLSKCLKD